MDTNWWVYILRCADGSYYTGISTDVERRLRQHNGELAGGAKCLRGRRPVVLVFRWKCEDRSAALRREASIKAMSHDGKVRLINACKNC